MKGSMAMGIGKRSLLTFLPQPGTVLSSAQSYKAAQSLRAFPRGLGSSSEVLQSQQVSKMCWRNPSREVQELLATCHDRYPGYPALGSHPFHPRSQPGWIHRHGWG